jgi:DNA-directed RNA polymerase subunit delta
MQRLIRSFNTLTDDLRDKLQEQYPDGIDNSHIRTLNTPKGDSLRVIELRTSEAIYLIKISAESREEIDQFLDQEEGGATPVDDEDGADADGLEAPDGADDEEDEKEEDMSVDDDDDGDKEEVGKDEDEDED